MTTEHDASDSTPANRATTESQSTDSGTTDRATGRSPAGSRRTFLRTVGSAAVLGTLGGVTAGTQHGVAASQDDEATDDVAAPWDVREGGVEDWEFTTESGGEIPDEPEVSVDDDRVVVSGGYQFAGAGCMTFYPRQVEYSEDMDRLGVVVDQVFRHELDPNSDPEYVDCGDAPERHAYELTVFPDEPPETVVVDELFTDDDRFVEQVDYPGPSVATAVDEYDWTLESGLPIEESETEATATFDGEQLVVEGVLPGGPEECVQPELERLQYGDARHDFEVDVALRAAAHRLPGEGCDGPETASRYELVATFDDELPPHVTVLQDGGAVETLTHPSNGPLLQNVEAYEFDAAYEPTELEDEPTVSFDGHEVTIRGSKEYSSQACRGVVPQAISFDESEGRLGVVLADVEAYDYCLDLAGTLVYELTAELPAAADVAVLETQFETASRKVYYPDGDPSTRLPSPLADYDLSIGESILPSDAAEIEPTITFDGDDAIVEGALTYGSSSCNEIGVTQLGQIADAGQLDVTVAARRQRTHMPHEDCTTDEAAARYELELTAAEDRLVHDLRVHENGGYAEHTVSASRDDPKLPEGVLDYELTTDRDVEDYHAVQSDPTVSFAQGTEHDTVVVEGVVELASGSCNTAKLTDVRFEDDGDHLAVRVDDARADGYPGGCTADAPPVRYRLEVAVESLPAVVTAEEGNEWDDDPLRAAVVDRADTGIGVPSDVLEYRVSVEEVASSSYVEADPSIALDDESEATDVVVEAALDVRIPCDTVKISNVRYEDDSEDHLAVRFDAVPLNRPRDDVDCFGDRTPVWYRGVLTLESVPDRITVEEAGLLGEPVRSHTEEFGETCVDVDGQTVCDLDGDGHYRDVNGDESVSNGDVTEFFGKQHTPAWDERTDLFDFDGNDDVGQGDVVELFHYVN